MFIKVGAQENTNSTEKGILKSQTPGGTSCYLNFVAFFLVSACFIIENKK